MARISFTIPTRPCEVMQISPRGTIREPKKALFHGLFTESQVIAPSALKGGHPGGTVQSPVAVVEFEDGTIERVPIESVRLLDSAGKFKEYDWEAPIT